MDLYKKRDRFYSKLYPNDLYAKLEFDKILQLLRAKCLGQLGEKAVDELTFQSKFDEIEKQLQETHEFSLLLNDPHLKFPSQNYLVLKDELKLLEIGNTVLREEQVFKIFKVLQTVQLLGEFFQDKEGERIELFPNIYAIVKPIEIDRNLLNNIKAIIDDEGKVRNNASQELASIRKAINRKYRELDSRFRQLVSEFRGHGWLEESGETIRAGRRVLSVKAEFKRKVKGVILDESATGKTSFIEPEATLQINNDIFEFQQEEKREIYRLLKELTDQIRVHRPALASYQNVLKKLDLIQAKARLANDLKAVKPILNRERTVEFRNARHPLLFLINKEAKKETIPLNFRLSIADRILVISGPNAGGKSVALKTVGLLQLMLQTGMLVPVDEGSTMGIFQQIFVDLGDEQSLENDLSTYSSRLLNMRYFLEHANNKTMILVDEFGSGTDPRFGGAIAEAILEEMRVRHAYGVITTHYSNLKVFVSENKGLVNANMAFDQAKMKALYKLETGKPGSSYAFELAEKCGLPNDILDKARSKVGADYREFDKLLASLQNEKVDLDQRSAKLENAERKFSQRKKVIEQKENEIKKKRQKVLLEAEKEAVAEIEKTRKKLERLVQEWNETKGDKKTIRKIQEELRADKELRTERVENYKDVVFYRPSVGEIEVGSQVQWRESEQEGVVLEIIKDRAVVEFGSMRTKLRLKELVVVQQREKQDRSRVSFDTISSTISFKSSLDVRGKNKQETLEELEGWIDQAVVSGFENLKIIHGKGTGVLRSAVRSYLRKRKEVASLTDEEPEYGGNGITIVKMQ